MSQARELAKRIGSALAGFFVGMIFGAVRAIAAASGGHGLLAEAVLTGSPFSVFYPHKTALLGSLLFWGLLGLFWRSVQVRQYLVLLHVGAALLAFAFVPEYRDWHRIRSGPTDFAYETLVVMIVHALALLLAVSYEKNEEGGDRRKAREQQSGDRKH